jgi:hypothetical protein
MKKIADFPYFEVQFKKQGDVHDQNEVQQVLDFLPGSGITDLFVISHGWNNDMNEARDLYQDFFRLVRGAIDQKRPAGIDARQFAVLGILWPSIRFADEDLIASGAASAEPGQSEKEELKQRLQSLKVHDVFDAPDADQKLEEARQLVDQLDTDPVNDTMAGRGIADRLRSLPGKSELHPDDGSDLFFREPVASLVDKLSRPDLLPVGPDGSGGDALDFSPEASVVPLGTAAGFDLFGGVKSAIRKVLNFTTYYQMKERAGIVGRKGAYQVLTRIRAAGPALKIHLVGHSFGGRLVTALADGPPGSPPVTPQSMTLLQAAFSHNGFAENFDGDRDGFFRNVVTGNKVSGPILISHSVKDLAVGVAYPVASKLSGDDALSLGDEKSPYGGMGRNGAQFTPEAVKGTALGPVGSTYAFQAGKLYNLKADSIIGGHSEIAKPEVIHAVLSAVATT